MSRPIISTLRFALLTTCLTTALAGCAGAGDDSETDWTGDTATQKDELWRAWRARRHLAPDSGTGVGGSTSAGGSTSTGGSVSVGGTSGQRVDVSGGCEVCARAQACCDDVSQRDGACSFSTADCEAMDAAAQAAYIEACKVEIQTIASVRTTMPSSCY